MVFNKRPVELAMSPFPMPEMTPPLTRTYFILTTNKQQRKKGKCRLPLLAVARREEGRRKKGQKSRCGGGKFCFAGGSKFPAAAGRKNNVIHSFVNNAQTRKVPKERVRDKTMSHLLDSKLCT